MADFLDIFKHVLPRAKAWRITIDKILRQFFEGLALEPDDIREFFDLRFFDIFPSTTTAIDEFREQFNLPKAVDEATDRLNIAAAWLLKEYQSETDIQNTLQEAGFDVYVHEWWQEPVIGGNPVPIDPGPLVGGTLTSLVSCGEPDMQCQEPIALCGNFDNVGGRILKNKTDKQGNPGAPTNPAEWPYFLYIGAATFPNDANVPADRQEEFERLLLKISPTQQWIGLLINYV